MIGHYLKSALARFRSQPVTTLAGVLTLALGLLALVTTLAVISSWRASDQGIIDGKRAISFTTAMKVDADNLAPIPFMPPVFAKYLREDVPELKAVAAFRPRFDVLVDAGDRALVLKGAQAEPGILDIFHFRFLAGDPRTAMLSDSSIILTQPAAERLFGKAPALGRRLVLFRQRNVVVTGVIAPPAQPTQFSGDLMFDYISVMPPDAPGTPEMWAGVTMRVYGLLPEGGTLSREALDRRLDALALHRIPPETLAKFKIVFRSTDIGKLIEARLTTDVFGIYSSISVVTALAGLGLLVLAVACLNYANLATAQAIGRAREIGMRKVLGAHGLGVLLQCWIEAALSTLVALAVAGLLLWLVAPILSAQTGIDMIGALMRDPGAMGAIAGLSLAAMLASAIYPAWIVWRVRPSDALRTGKARGGPRGVMHVLVGLQFAAASVLLIAVVIVNQQNSLTRDLAFHAAPDPVVVLNPASLGNVNAETLRQQLAPYPQIRAISTANALPWVRGENVFQMSRTPDADISGPKGVLVGVGFGYFDVYGQKLLAGRVYDPARDAATPSVYAPPAPARTSLPIIPLVIERTFCEQLGFASPRAAAGQQIYSGLRAYEIIGVVEAQPHQIQSISHGGTIYALSQNVPSDQLLVRISAGDVDGGLAALRRMWSQLAPGAEFGYRFTDQLFEDNFKAFDRIGAMFIALSLLAFLISAIGLFGMAVHTTQRRTHEIGVRKTLGSTAREVVTLLLADFSRPVIVANLLSWPIAWYAAQAYLAPFAHRIDLGFTPFAGSLIATLVIAWLAVGGQTIRAANLRPAEVLRRS